MMLYDQFGRPIEPLKKPETREIAVQQIRDRWSTYPSSGLTPQRLANILKSADQGDVLRQAELFEEMEEKDAHLASQFQTRKLAVQGLSWEVIPASEEAADKKIAEFCAEVLNGLSDFDDNILDMLDALPKGYSVMEIMWDVSSGRAIIRDLAWIHPKKITFWDSTTPRVLTDEDPVRGIDPPGHKIVYHRYKARSGYDTRAGILRVCAWMYLFKNYALKDWVGFAEIYGMPLRVGKYDPGASKGDKDALLAAIRSLGSDAAGIISKSTEIEFIEAQKAGGTSGQNIFEALVRFCNAQMSKAILGQTLTSEAGGEKGQGSLALGKVHGDVRQDIIEADCRALGKTITEQILRPLVGFNDPRGWAAPVPRFKFLYEPPEDLKAAAETYKILRDMGFDMSQEHVSARFKVPVRAESETPLGAPQPANQQANLAKFTARSAGSRRDAADMIDSQLQAVAAAEMDAMIERIRALVDQVYQDGGSLEDLRDRLIDLYGDLDPERLGELMQRAFALADISGRFDGLGGS